MQNVSTTPISLSASAWQRLNAIRQKFLETLEHESRKSASPLPPYWQNETDLTLYDQVFARRIAWKWQSVCAHAKVQSSLRALLSTIHNIVDFGCGSGAASEVVMTNFPESRLKNWIFYDHSNLATKFCERKFHDLPNKNSTRQVDDLTDSIENAPSLFLLSHVLSELIDLPQVLSGNASVDDTLFDPMRKVLAILRKQAGFIWVEPGTPATSFALGRIRDQWLDTHLFLAPCPDTSTCPAVKKLSAAKDHHNHSSHGRDYAWCHSFAHPPAEVFTSAFWAEVRTKLRLDLTSLPVSFLFAVRKDLMPALTGKMEQILDKTILGRPRKQKFGVTVDVCQQGEIKSESILKRQAKDKIKLLEKNCFFA